MMIKESRGLLPTDIKYSILDPTGNITALVESRVDISRQPEVADEIMKRHPQVEQVGFVRFGNLEESLCQSSVSGKKRIDAELRMAGGEFCGNASLCAAALYLIRSHESNRENVGIEELGEPEEFQSEQPVTSVRLRVSGAGQEIEVRLNKEAADSFFGGIHMPPPCRIEEKKLLFNNITETVPIVSMEGISHIIIAEDSEFFGLRDEQELAGRAVREWCESLKADGLGLMFLERQAPDIFLTPLVYIPGSGTMYWENSCASGTAASAVYLAKKERSSLSLSFHEPGGKLEVYCEPLGKDIWLYGKIRLVSTYS